MKLNGKNSLNSIKLIEKLIKFNDELNLMKSKEKLD